MEDWLKHWSNRGLGVIEKMLTDDYRRGPYSHGSQPTIADIALVAQVFTANKYGVETSGFSRVSAVYDICMQHPAFCDTAPALQPDAPADS